MTFPPNGRSVLNGQCRLSTGLRLDRVHAERRSTRGRRSSRRHRTGPPGSYYEGVPIYYRRITVFVKDGDGRLHRALAYKMRNDVTDATPSLSYVLTITLGEVRIAPGHDPISGCQVYLCIAWFRRAELVVQHGRRGYSLPIAAAKFTAKVKAAWGELQDR